MWEAKMLWCRTRRFSCTHPRPPPVQIDKEEVQGQSTHPETRPYLGLPTRPLDSDVVAPTPLLLFPGCRRILNLDCKSSGRSACASRRASRCRPRRPRYSRGAASAPSCWRSSSVNTAWARTAGRGCRYERHRGELVPENAQGISARA
jgi:hypothetical protein